MGANGHERRVKPQKPSSSPLLPPLPGVPIAGTNLRMGLAFVLAGTLLAQLPILLMPLLAELVSADCWNTSMVALAMFSNREFISCCEGIKQSAEAGPQRQWPKGEREASLDARAPCPPGPLGRAGRGDLRCLPSA